MACSRNCSRAFIRSRVACASFRSRFTSSSIVIRYESHGRQRKGVASTFLAERCNDQPVPVFPSVAKHFHLPEGDADIIMVGPGTGIAPLPRLLAGTPRTRRAGAQLALLRRHSEATTTIIMAMSSRR